MKLFVPAGPLRRWQMVGDVLTAAWCGLCAVVGVVTHNLLERLAGPGRAAREAGDALADTALRGGGRVDDLPLVGDTLKAPFTAIAEAGRALAAAGAAQEQAAQALALWLALAAILPAALVLLPYVGWRLRTMARARAAARLRAGGAGLELFALRALASQPLARLRQVHPDPWAAFVRGEVVGLAELELRRLGIDRSP